MEKCHDCDVEAPMTDMHYDVLGDGSIVRCDSCYYSRQPWHSGLESNDGLIGSD